MEKKQGFFSALREEVVRGLSPARSRSREKSTGSGRSPAAEAPALFAPRRRKGHGRHQSLSLPPDQAALVARSVSFRETLAPLMEGPDGGGSGDDDGAPTKEGWGRWVRGQLSRAPSVTSSSAGGASSSFRRSDLRLLLGVMGAPLAPLHVSCVDPLPHLSIKNTPIVSYAFFSFIALFTSLPRQKPQLDALTLLIDSGFLVLLRRKLQIYCPNTSVAPK